MILPFLLWAAAASGAAQACLPVDGERILGRDLAAAIPAFAAVPGDLPLGFAPALGARRVFHLPELQRLALRYQIALEDPREICFARLTENLTREALLGAFARMPELAGAKIEIVEFSRHPVPRGELVFARDGLESAAAPASDTPLLWKGFVRTASSSKFVIWARVKISAPQKRAVAVERLPVGQAIRQEQLRLESWEGLAAPSVEAQSLEQVVGRVPRRTIAAGSVVRLDWLQEAPEILRGDRVDVELQNGAIRLASVGRAESNGQRGARIPVRNLESGKVFAALVAGPGKVIVPAWTGRAK